jgi:hypothetical protein
MLGRKRSQETYMSLVFWLRGPWSEVGKNGLLNTWCQVGNPYLTPYITSTNFTGRSKYKRKIIKSPEVYVRENIELRVRKYFLNWIYKKTNKNPSTNL